MAFFIAMMASFTFFGEPAERGLESLQFMVGEWEFQTKHRKQDGTFGSQAAHASAVWILDGQAIQDTYGEVHDGKLRKFGHTIRSYDASQKKFRMLWYSANLRDYTVFEGGWVGDELHFKGEGVLNGTKFLERVTFFEIGPNGYSWNMDRSYDVGKTWIESLFSYRATR